jgi:glycosyltransferase involved in cell wall biosynthesis
MNVLHLSTFDIDGGAARAAYRLHQGLIRSNVNSKMLVQEKSSDDRQVLAPKSRLSQCSARSKVVFDAAPLKLYRQRPPTMFSLQWLPDRTLTKIRQTNPDIINLHWLNSGFLQIETLRKLQLPIVWTLHDMWPFTGGCHYSEACDRYIASCGACPQLNSHSSQDLSSWIWKRKQKAWKDLNLTIVATTSWMAKSAQSSSLFQALPIECIPYGLDTDQYKPIPKNVARDLLGLPQDKYIILFGALQAASDQRKGFHLLQAALQNLCQMGWQEKIELLVFGASEPENSVDLGFKTRYLGHLSDDLSLAIFYSSADVMVVPSIQEAFGQTALEALACATPVAAFKTTGLIDIVDHQQNGYLAEPFSPQDLAKGISWILENSERRHHLSRQAREKVEREFTLKIQADRYRQLFEKILTRTSLQPATL